VDIVKGGWWLENPRDPLHDKWPEHWFVRGWPDRAGVTVADINQDGRRDVVLSAAETEGRLSWFEAPREAIRGTWKEHLIQDPVDYAHTFKVADMNNDGKPDVVFAEMQQSAHKRVGFFLNEGGGANWKLQVVATTGSHNIRVADVDRDGDFDIIGANWNTETDPNHAPTEMWRNLLNDRRHAQHLSLDKWTYIPIDSQRGKWGDFDKPEWLRYFGLAIGDVNGDGLLDISARYGKDGKSLAWWQNPGNGSGNWVRHTVGQTPIEMDRDVMADINGDGRPDIVVTEENAWSGDSVFWFEQTGSRGNPNWLRHTLVTQFTTNSLEVADMNNDGNLDVIAAEHRGTKKLEIWESIEHASSWIEHVISTGRENHIGARAADLDGDGNLDIVGAAWDGYEHLHLWRNDAILKLGGARSVSTPTIAPAGGNGSGTWLVHLTTETVDATIRYTLDGSEPTTSSALYAEPLMIAGSATIKARAFKSGMNNSDSASAAFTTTNHY
jgi:Chitobiase/beta-hexosaminidase C-terminal domain/FG-GAP-like repeat